MRAARGRSRKEKSTQSRERGQGGTSSLFVCPLRSPEAAPLVGFGATPQLFLVKSIQREQPTKGAGSEASLPVTLRIRRCAPKLLYPSTQHCRARWARPTFRPKRQTPECSLHSAAFRRFLSSRIIPSQSKHTSCRPPSCIRECCWRGSFQVRADTSG